MNTLVPSESASFWTESLAQDLLGFLRARVKCPETAADLTHETYLRLYQRIIESPPDNARALAFHIAVNLAIDYQRKITVRKRYLADGDLDTYAETVVGTAIEPEHILIAQQRLATLQQALSELPAECRTAFLLHGRDGLKYSDIAARLGVSESMVGKHIGRALKHCAHRLDTPDEQ
ncbi:MAG: RNA polymerase sigma factor [Methylococcales bacterium]